MGFGGGGGSTGVSNHVHSAAVGEGGSLSTSETLISDSNLYSRIVICLLYTSPSPRDRTRSRMPSSA